jgi:undecaprenyl phosphate N,N'-diacetylbacillosamine 1-phosphate transferase
MYKKYGKRALDAAGAALLLILFAPLSALVAFFVFFFLGRPVLFLQRRPGKDEKIFEIKKFRTMLPEISSGVIIPESKRITTLGRLLRVTSLDELPQLWNILIGDMSFVGPRPLLEEYIPLYTQEERLRHSVRPGLTGLAQINGRNFLGARERLALDVEYARRVSLALDLKILMRTVFVVFLQSGVQVCPAEQSANFVAERQQAAAVGRISPERNS